jgi:hypothetical protein
MGIAAGIEADTYGHQITNHVHVRRKLTQIVSKMHRAARDALRSSNKLSLSNYTLY